MTNAAEQKRDPFIKMLRSEFERRKARNAAYSLRSYARDLTVDTSNLSKLLGYKKTAGYGTRLKIGSQLGFGPHEIFSLFIDRQATTGDESYNHHNFEVFQVISDWQHYAILEMFKLEGFRATASYIEEISGIPAPEAAEALARLQKVGMLRRDAEGRLVPSDHSSSSILETATSKAHREQQRQILEGATKALDNIPVEIRSQSSMTIAVDSEKLEAAKLLIKKFRRDLGRLMSNSKNLNAVYQLSVSLYPVTTNKKGH